ncbi:MAG TPA: MFS transporter [Candidatus Pelethocola excrementipullorum]|nr:MFS transporter [Candidatus Pelethocola excrementipullorum]
MKDKKKMILFITILAFFGMFIGNYGNYQLTAVPGSVYQAYNLTDSQFSSIMTAPMFPSIFLSIIIGILVDRFGISKMVSICYLIGSAGFIMRIFATDYKTMFLSMALTGAGCMILNSNLAKIVSSLYPMEKVGNVVGILMAGSTASMAVAYATTAMFPSLQVAFWTAAIASMIVSLLWLLFVREKHFTEEDAPVMETVPVKQALISCFKSKNIWLMGVSLLFLLGGATVISNFQVTALTSLKGYSEAFAGTFGTVLMIGAILGSILIPVLVGKYRKQAPMILLICGLVTALSTVGIIALPAAGIYVACFLNGALRSGIIAVMMSLPVMFEEIGPKYAGTAGGLAVTLELLGAVIIPTYIIVPLGSGSISAYFYLGAASIVIASLLCFLVAKTCGVYKTN